MIEDNELKATLFSNLSDTSSGILLYFYKQIMLKTSQDILNEHDRRFTYGLLWYFLLETHDSDYGYSLMFFRENVPNEVIHEYLQKKFNKYILKSSQYNIESGRM